jgi:2'-5' RNA ligase
MADRARLFFALDLPHATSAALHELQRRSMPFAERFAPSWTRREKMHLTLCFLGDVDVEHVDGLSRAMQDCARDVHAFDVVPERLTTFPDTRRARVLVVELAADERLERFAAELGHAAERFGIPRERRPFRGHLTLARFKTPGNAAFLVEATSLALETARLSQLRLYESRGGEYIPKSSVSLATRVASLA